MWDIILAALPGVFLYAARVAGVALAAPWFSQANTPTQVRVALVFMIALSLWLALGADPWTGAEPTLALLVMPLELLVGLTLGFSVRLLVAVLEIAGEFMAFQMGYAAAAAFDPTVGAVSSPPTRLLYMVGLMVFLAIDGHHQVLLALASSYDVVPVGAAGVGSIDAEVFLRLVSGLFHAALQLALPLMVVMLTVNLVLGLMVRFLPQLNVFTVGFILTIGMGLWVMVELMPSLGLWMETLLGSSSNWLSLLLKPPS
ncbi:MAG: flagellar biosynthetic protein FliR [Myxococcales bacterium]|nr:flagellar biosynthetic protein FliR [Myxococcales bacterium]